MVFRNRLCIVVLRQSGWARACQAFRLTAAPDKTVTEKEALSEVEAVLAGHGQVFLGFHAFKNGRQTEVDRLSQCPGQDGALLGREFAGQPGTVEFQEGGIHQGRVGDQAA